VIGPDRVSAPHAVYKIIGWQKTDGKFTARGYIIKQDDSGSGFDRVQDTDRYHQGTDGAALLS
jgi:hypothetical protein